MGKVKKRGQKGATGGKKGKDETKDKREAGEKEKEEKQVSLMRRRGSYLQHPSFKLKYIEL